MLDRVILACKLTDKIYNLNADYIGVDKGALFLAQNKIDMEVAIGDFDSIAIEDLDLIKKYTKALICLNPIKDKSDSEEALDLAFKMGYKEVTMIGCLGKRFDHTYVNLLLLDRGNISLMDDNNFICIYDRGEYDFYPSEYKYISFFPLEESLLSLKNMKYNLNNKMLEKGSTLGLSNEIEGVGHLSLHEGKLLCIRSKD